MQLKQAIGNTWYLEDWQIIPLYKTSEHTCVLLDSGLRSQRELIEKTLSRAELEIVGILGSHVHGDHSANHRYFQEKYHIPVALSAGEAGIAVTPLNLKAYYFYMLHPQVPMTVDMESDLLVEADVVIRPRQEKIEFCGAEFGIIHTPGHTPDHISIVTPDDVCYLGDAILTDKFLSGAKLPYFFAVAPSIQAMRQLGQTHHRAYLAAHRGLYEDVAPLAAACEEAVNVCAARIWDVAECGMTKSEIVIAACEVMKMLSSKPRKAAFYERNVHIYVDYLVDIGALEISVKGGVEYYMKNDNRPDVLPDLAQIENE